MLGDKELTKVSTAPTITAEDTKVVDFWNTQYLPYCELHPVAIGFAEGDLLNRAPKRIAENRELRYHPEGNVRGAVCAYVGIS